MRILEVTPNKNYSYEGRKDVIKWFYNYYRLIKISGIKSSMNYFYNQLPNKIKKQIKCNIILNLRDSGIKLNFLVIDEVINNK